MVWNYLTDRTREDEQGKKQIIYGIIVSTAIIGLTLGFTIASVGVLRPDTLHGQTNGPEDELTIQSGYANISANNTVDRVRLIVTKGSESVDLSGVSVTWNGPSSSTSLVSVAVENTNSVDSPVEEQHERFKITPVQDQDDSFPVLNAESDQFELIFNASAIEGKQLQSGQTITLKFTLADRSVVVYTIELPTSLNGNSTVEV